MSQQLQQVHPNVLAKILKQRTLYQNEEIVVIDKPYGLPVHGEGEWGMEMAPWCLWAIVLGDPDPVEGVVEIPIVEKEVKSHQSHYKMTLAPRFRVCPEDGRVVKARGDRHAERAVTRYRRLAAASACSLLQLQPIT
ncbi:hypothetical protein EK904_005367, partial [Melospiza melodia maxima]